ncbi:MAG TPA: hypothetical protein VFK32_05500 [Tepidiformaceae bacterium]|nr:hypothetical protein [Tepidiformaceae bacterium]
MAPAEPGTPLFRFASQIDPDPLHARLRETAPVYLEPQFGTYVLTRFEDVSGSLRDHATFSSGEGIAPGFIEAGAIMSTMITSDPPRYTRLRALVNSAFTPRMIAQLEPSMRQVVDELLREVEGETNLLDALTHPLPVIVIARLLGIPEDDHPQFKAWSDAVARAQEPRNDLIGGVVHAEIDGQKLTERGLLGFCLLLLVAGNERTTNPIGNPLAVLIADRGTQERLRSDQSLVAGSQPPRTSPACAARSGYAAPPAVSGCGPPTRRQSLLRSQTVPNSSAREAGISCRCSAASSS